LSLGVLDWTGRRSVQGRPQIQIFEVVEQHVPGM
jgi:hypothetical protein